MRARSLTYRAHTSFARISWRFRIRYPAIVMEAGDGDPRLEIAKPILVVLIAALRAMQLVNARAGTTDQILTDTRWTRSPNR